MLNCDYKKMNGRLISSKSNSPVTGTGSRFGQSHTEDDARVEQTRAVLLKRIENSAYLMPIILRGTWLQNYEPVQGRHGSRAFVPERFSPMRIPY